MYYLCAKFILCANTGLQFNIMNDSQHRIRIKDIAKLAGVSEGTVDRVLHNRGEVSEKSKVAVNEVLKQLNYSPNLIARSLASKKHFHFVALIPEHRKDEYWESIEKGFEIAENEFVHHNISIEIVYFNQYDSTSFGDSASRVLEINPDAVFLSPVFKNEALVFTDKLFANSIPFSFIDSMLEEAHFLTYYGQNSLHSGFIGAKLLFDMLPDFGKVLVIRTQRKGENFSNQTLNRYEGFLKFIKEERNCCYEIINVELIDADENTNIQKLDDLFKLHSDIKGAITFNSKVYRLAKYLKSINRPDVVLVGYDLLKENIEFLKNGIVSYLIAQRPEKQAYFSVLDMCNELIFHTSVQKINYMPIDILMRENIDYYMDFRD